MAGLFLISLIYIVVYPLSTKAGIFYTNTTEPVCLTLSSNLTAPSPTETLKINRNNSLVIVRLFSGKLTILDVHIYNALFQRDLLDAKFCIINTTFNHAGVYTLIHNEDIIASSTLFVLGKPGLPIISVLENGTVNGSLSSVCCEANSTSKPTGLNISYEWLINETDITFDQKYSFNDQSKTIMFINPDRTEGKNRYSCKAVEERGQSSDKSEDVTIDPDRLPTVTLLPETHKYRLIENETLALECMAEDGKPSTYSYMWHKNDVQLSMEISYSLKMPNLTFLDSGNYSCSAENSLGLIKSKSITVDVLFGPMIRPIEAKYQEDGQSISVFCNISSNPDIPEQNVTWHRPNNSSFLRNNRTLNISNVHRIDDGVFICSATISFFPTSEVTIVRNASESFDLNVLYGPTIRLVSTYAQIEERGISILCNVSSNPQVTASEVTWTKNGIFQTNGFYLTFHSVKRKHGGKYECSAQVTLNVSVGKPVNRSSTEEIELNILYGPEVILQREFRQIRNKPINITCNIRSNPKPRHDDIHWLHNGIKIKEGPNLIFASASQNQTGVYNCSVDLTLDPTENVPEKRSATNMVLLDVLYGPVVTSYDAFPTIEGNLLVIMCNVSSNPTAENDDVVWTKHGNNSFHGSGLELIFNAVDRKDLGQFICNVSICLNPSEGPAEERHNFGRVTVNVNYQPDILYVTSVTVDEGSRVQINCSVDGNPAPTFLWTYVENGTAIEQHEISTDNLISTSSILLSLARCEDTGTYRCQADNDITFATNRTAAVVVKCRPRFIYSGGSTVTIGRNDTLNLTVMFHAVPKPTFKWCFNKSDLSGFNIQTIDDNLPYIFGTRLTKTYFGESDIGEYSINATNELGSVSENVIVLYEREPYKPTLFDLNCQEVAGTAKLVWMSPGNGGRRQHFIILYRPSNRLDFSKSDIYNENRHSNEYTEFVFNLQENVEYIFRIEAKNDIGHIMSNEMNCTVQAVDHSSLLPIIGSVCGSIAGITVACAVFCIHRRRRNQPNTKTKLIDRKIVNDEDDDEGLKDNPLYVQSGPAGKYPIHDKKSEDNKQTEDGKGSGKQIEMAEIYENSDDIVPYQAGPVYGNVNKDMSFHGNETYAPKKNKDGLVYADLVFNSSSSRFVIRGLENKSCYADIDYTQKAEPLPSDSDGD